MSFNPRFVYLIFQVSLSEVLHDAGASSSFDDDNDEDNIEDNIFADEEDEELLIIKQMGGNEEDEEDVDEIPPQGGTTDQRGIDGGTSSPKDTNSASSKSDKMAAGNYNDSLSSDPRGPPDPKREGYHKVEADITSEDSQDSGKLCKLNEVYILF